MAGAIDGLHQLLIVGLGQALQIANGVKSDVVLVKRSCLRFDGLGQQRHQTAHLGYGTVPVLGGESIQSQILNFLKFIKFEFD